MGLIFIFYIHGSILHAYLWKFGQRLFFFFPPPPSNNCVCTGPESGSSLRVPAEGTKGLEQWRGPAKESSGHEIWQTVQAADSPSEEEGAQRASRPEYTRVRIAAGWFFFFFFLFPQMSKVRHVLFFFVPRQYDKVHEKREEIVDQIKNINRETTQLKAKMQKLRDTCNQNTEKAQVSISLSRCGEQCISVHLGELLTHFTLSYIS